MLLIVNMQERLNENESRVQEVSDTRTLAYNAYATTYARWQEVLKTAGIPRMDRSRLQECPRRTT